MQIDTSSFSSGELKSDKAFSDHVSVKKTEGTNKFAESKLIPFPCYQRMRYLIKSAAIAIEKNDLGMACYRYIQIRDREVKELRNIIKFGCYSCGSLVIEPIIQDNYFLPAIFFTTTLIQTYNLTQYKIAEYRIHNYLSGCLPDTLLKEIETCDFNFYSMKNLETKLEFLGINNSSLSRKLEDLNDKAYRLHKRRCVQQAA